MVIRLSHLCILLLLTVSAVACVTSASTECGGEICPPTTTCINGRSGCYPITQITACGSLAEGSLCVYNGAEGVCDQGLCTLLSCGDTLIDVGEQCDGSNLGEQSCLDFGYYDQAGLTCTLACSFDKSSCTGFCGDGEINGPPGAEACDSAPAPFRSCLDIGLDYGNLGCNNFCTFEQDDCRRLGWQRQFNPTDATLIGVWSASSNQRFAVGERGTIIFFDGVLWTAMDSGVSTTLRAVWGSSITNVYAVGDKGVVVHFDGTSWSTQSIKTDQTLTSVIGIDSEHVYVGGANSTLFQSDDDAWRRIKLESSLDISDIATSGKSLIAVGQFKEQGASIYLSEPGDDWKPASASAPIVAVDSIGTNGTVEFIGLSSSGLHVWKDGQWDLEHASSRLVSPTAMAAFARDDVFIADLAGRSQGRVFHFNGTDMYTFQEGSNSGFDFSALTRDNIVAVGYRGLIHRYAGAGLVTAAKINIERPIALTVLSPDLAYAVGLNNNSTSRIERLSNQAWETMVDDIDVPILAIAARQTAKGPTVVFGGKSGRLGWLNSSGLKQLTLDADTINAVLFTTNTLALAVTDDGQMFQINLEKGAVQTVSLPSSISLSSVASSSPTLAFVGGKDSALFRGNPEIGMVAFSPSLPTPPGVSITSIVATTASQPLANSADQPVLFAAVVGGVDEPSAVYKFDPLSDQWTRSIALPGARRIQLAASSSGDVWLISDTVVNRSMVHHFDGSRWSPVRLSSERPVSLSVNGRTVGLVTISGRIEILARTGLP